MGQGVAKRDNANYYISKCLFRGVFISFRVFEYEDVKSSVFLAFLMFDFKIEFFYQFLPIAVREVSPAHEIIAPFDVFVVVELDDVGESLVH
jgi:hypothetical protein